MVECCPICGKKPRLKIKVYGNHWGAEIVCKPFLKKAHLSTFAADENRVDAVREAINVWNAMVILRNEMVILRNEAVEKIENYVRH